MDDITRVKERYQKSILKKANVVGVGIGYKKVKQKKTDMLSIAVLVEKKLPLALLRRRDVIQGKLEGISTDVQEIGSVKALSLKAEERMRTERWRPAPGGVSIGHYKVSSGTLGAIITDKRSSEKLILSNNHVLADSNMARIGDPVLQPGPFDGGKRRDEIAYVHRVVPLSFSVDPAAGSLASAAAWGINLFFRVSGADHRLIPVRICDEENTVDAAAALPLMESIIQDKILSIGVLKGTKRAELGMTVEKSGRTTGYSIGVVDLVETTIIVHYSYQKTALFSHQIGMNLTTNSGDSGAVVASQNRAVGLLFARSKNVSFCNPIHDVLTALKSDLN